MAPNQMMKQLPWPRLAAAEDVEQTAGISNRSVMHFFFCCAAALIGGCSTPPDAAEAGRAFAWSERTEASVHPDIVGIYRGGSPRGRWELQICADDSIRIAMRHADSAEIRTFRGTWCPHDYSHGRMGLVLELHSEDGRALRPSRMRASYRPPDNISMSWPGPSGFVDPPGLYWECERVAADATGISR